MLWDWKDYLKHTAIESEAYAIPYVWQTSGAPKGLPFSLQTAGTIIRSMFPRFPVKNTPEMFQVLKHGTDPRPLVTQKTYHAILWCMQMQAEKHLPAAQQPITSPRRCAGGLVIWTTSHPRTEPTIYVMRILMGMYHLHI